MYHPWVLRSYTAVFPLVLQWQKLNDLTVFNAQRSSKKIVKTDLNKVRMQPCKNAWINLHDVSRTYTSKIYVDFVVVFSLVFSVFFVVSPRRFLTLSGRFVMFGPSSSHPSLSIPGFHPSYWSASTKCLCLCWWVTRNTSWIDQRWHVEYTKANWNQNNFETGHLWNFAVLQKIGTKKKKQNCILWHKIITKLIPWKLFFVIFEWFRTVGFSRKDFSFQGVMLEIRNFHETDYFWIIFRK